MFTVKCREIIKSMMLNIDSEEHRFTFRVDIIQENDQTFTAELYELISYRMAPSFDVPEHWEANKEVWVLASHQLRDTTPSNSIEECMRKVLFSLNYTFGFLNKTNQ